mgnify:CR=1 FL=1
MFIGNEFDDEGFLHTVDQAAFRVCKNSKICGKTKISIIDGTNKNEVISPADVDPKINYALPKSKFAELILTKKIPFDKMNFESFIPIFRMIKKIITEEEWVD